MFVELIQKKKKNRPFLTKCSETLPRNRCRKVTRLVLTSIENIPITTAGSPPSAHLS